MSSQKQKVMCWLGLGKEPKWHMKKPFPTSNAADLAVSNYM